MAETEVLVVGAGPVGLTAAIELRRRGVRCRIIDPLVEPPQYAKAVGVQPRTLEVFEGMGVLRQILDSSTQMRGQVVYVNGEEAGRLDLELPDDVPFGFSSIPQYVTERILRERLATLDLPIERGKALTGFSQHDDGVTATLSTPDGEETVEVQYLVGADGAHSVTRKTLGLSFEGAAFEEQYMLGDVEVDWSQPAGYGIRAMHQTDGKTDDLLVCIPLFGRGRYRMSMLVPDELATAKPERGAIAHGFEGEKKPELSHIQAVLDRLSPEPTTARNLRWSSVFRISHRIVDSYGHGRVFVAGDAAHIHPPTGGQGMNTGIQDAHNLAWKLALAVQGKASDGLTASYDAERRPVGEEVVGRTVRSAREGIGAGETDPAYVMRREAQLLIEYADSPIIEKSADDAILRPGVRAPDAKGLTREIVTDPIRLFSLFDRLRHTAVIYLAGATSTDALLDLEAIADQATATAHGELDVYLVASPDAEVAATVLPVIRDTAGTFAEAYGPQDRSLYVIRPDGYLAYSAGAASGDDLLAHLKKTFR
ncbi:2-polyprenyl-6-methoxyphenol hydroxylase-like FAD-dependent oxidoreductase [Williamsia limnetica]|uniref:2-polyprenyl-6-methoxyphenol hydroxylase-like FAD-dependent oxidoreductase n=1 Tax=Williamsia limnetica TaxID=882452 RepID=A0A318RWH4_WILLI|nr:FAD-dependent monooxygenase [Williamsia limnetica]PYE17534.1 2-polyprenyl-6-methoxyphenol hydroxylase-like FAD-dependent oxidoreductase [Williamsia limnetica]